MHLGVTIRWHLSPCGHKGIEAVDGETGATGLEQHTRSLVCRETSERAGKTPRKPQMLGT